MKEEFNSDFEDSERISLYDCDGNRIKLNSSPKKNRYLSNESKRRIDAALGLIKLKRSTKR
jgi:hypothetical protein